MEYNLDGTMKQTLRLYPMKLYKNSGEVVVANNDQERNAAIAEGAKLTSPPVVAVPPTQEVSEAPAPKPKTRSAR